MRGPQNQLAMDSIQQHLIFSLNAEQKLYFSDQFKQTILSIKFDGSGCDTFYEVTGRPAAIFGLGIYGSDVYWADWEWTTLFRKNKFDGLEPEAVAISNLEMLKRGFLVDIYQGEVLQSNLLYLFHSI